VQRRAVQQVPDLVIEFASDAERLRAIFKTERDQLTARSAALDGRLGFKEPIPGVAAD
jgi:hypothetical protein